MGRTRGRTTGSCSVDRSPANSLNTRMTPCTRFGDPLSRLATSCAQRPVARGCGVKLKIKIIKHLHLQPATSCILIPPINPSPGRNPVKELGPLSGPVPRSNGGDTVRGHAAQAGVVVAETRTQHGPQRCAVLQHEVNPIFVHWQERARTPPGARPGVQSSCCRQPSAR
jgi:hypothetical protein